MTTATAVSNTQHTESSVKRLYRQFTQSLVNYPSLGAYYEPLIQMLWPQWSQQQYRAQVISKRLICQNILQIVLKPSHSWPGFIPGQYIDLHVEIEGRLYHRRFSLSASRTLWRRQRHIELTLGIQDMGKVTPWLASQLHPKQWVRISAAAGDFTLQQSQQPQLMIAAGTGISPIKSMLTSRSAQSGPATLLYFYRGTAAHHQELASLNSEHCQIHFIDTQVEGHLDQALLERYCPDVQQRAAYLCGPGSLIAEGRDLLQAQGVAEENIHYEYFGLPPQPLGDDIGEHQVRFISQQHTTEATSSSGQNLLQLAEQQQLSPQYGCRMGVCHQCRCSKLSGQVLNTLTGQTSDTGPEEIQLCISVPLTDTDIQL